MKDAVPHAKLRRMAPALGDIGALLVAAAMLATAYAAWPDVAWPVLLAGGLGACLLSLGGRFVRATGSDAQHTAELDEIRRQLAGESRLRARAEQQLAAMEVHVAYLHEALPVMLAYIDDHHQLRYHNRAFRQGLGNAGGRLEGRHLREVLGNIFYGELVDDISTAFGGQAVHRDRTHNPSTGETFRLLMQYLPHRNSDGTVAGVFLLATEMAGPAHIVIGAAPAVTSGLVAIPAPQLDEDRPAAASATPEDDAQRLRDALANDEFCLYFQSMVRLGDAGMAIPFHEILLRLKVEEESMLPPGSFLPVAEMYGMMPDLDRWVVKHLLGWMRADGHRQQAMYSINISAPTLADPAFPSFVHDVMRAAELPGELLCFELQEADLLKEAAGAARFAEALRAEGCRFAICGFGGNRASFDMLRRFPVHFLKIDGSLILNISQSSVDLARVKAIHRVAQAIGINTVAQCVEDDRTLAVLRTIGVDFAQGFGIARPQALLHLDAIAAAENSRFSSKDLAAA